MPEQPVRIGIVAEMLRSLSRFCLPVALALVVASCSASVESPVSSATTPTSAPTAPAPTTPAPTTPASATPAVAANEGLCELVDDGVLEAVANAEIVTSSESQLQGMPLCMHETATGGRLQIVSLPAADWAAALPQLIEFVQDSGLLDDPENQAKFEQAEEILAEGAAGAGEAACDLFSLLVEVQGLEPGSKQVVNFVPNAAAPLAVNGQRCTNAVFSSVQLQADGIVDDQPTYDRIDDALAIVHEAGGGN